MSEPRPTRRWGSAGRGSQQPQPQWGGDSSNWGNWLPQQHGILPVWQPHSTQWWTQDARVWKANGSSSWPAANLGGAATQEWYPPAGTAAGWKASGKGADGRGKGRGKGKTGRGGADWGDRDRQISKTLTQVLRHKASDLGLEISPDGYCKVEDVLKVQWLSELNCTLEDLERVVGGSDKQRFQLCPDKVQIRAVQGHSIKAVIDEYCLTKMDAETPELPEHCVHGTYHKHLESIFEHGLIAGGGHGEGFRNHIHFAPFEPGDKRVISGMRYDCEVSIYINLKQALQHGIPFFTSVNQVILSPGIEGVIAKKYFLKVWDLKTQEEIPIPPDSKAS